MEISHVIRAEEWISSTLNVLLYQAFSWKMPVCAFTFAEIKINQNFLKEKSNVIRVYKRKGVLPHALVNFLALMGWSNSDDQEIFSYDDILKIFSK